MKGFNPIESKLTIVCFLWCLIHDIQVNYHTFSRLKKVVASAKFLNNYFPYPVFDENNNTVGFLELFLREKLLPPWEVLADSRKTKMLKTTLTKISDSDSNKQYSSIVHRWEWYFCVMTCWLLIWSTCGYLFLLWMFTTPTWPRYYLFGQDVNVTTHYAMVNPNIYNKLSLICYHQI